MEKNQLPLRIGVGAIVLNKENKVFVGRRIDNPVNNWQMPQGGANKSEPLLEAMKRELQEEIGMIPKDVELWSPFFVAPGWCTEKIYCFFATNLESSKLESDIDEEIYIKKLEISEIHCLIQEKKITDLKTITAFYVFKE